MKEKVLFFASENSNLNEIPKGEKVYHKLTKCVLNKAFKILSYNEIKPTYGTLYCPTTGETTYTMIERYDNQFKLLKRPISIYLISLKEAKIDDKFLLIDDARVIKRIDIDNLFDYVKSMKNTEFLYNDDLDKTWYDVPFDNGDIIKENFLNIIFEPNKQIKKTKIKKLKSLFPNQKEIINKLYKVVLKMDKEQAREFISNIFDKRHRRLNYDLINKEHEKNKVKHKIKSLF